MPLVLILEDSPSELKKAVEAARCAGFTELETSAYASDVRIYLEKAIDGKVPLPKAMVVDLDLGIESGYEVLRLWHRIERLRAIPVVVWTVMGQHEREICSLFGVTRFVAKQGGLQALVDALTGIVEIERPHKTERPA